MKGVGSGGFAGVVGGLNDCGCCFVIWCLLVDVRVCLWVAVVLRVFFSAGCCLVWL